jgi:hypothetical protein
MQVPYLPAMWSFPVRLLKKADSAEWTWEPQPVVDHLVLGNRWSTLEPVDLRLRALATLPFDLEELPERARIDQASRRRLETALRAGQLSNFLRACADWRVANQ